MLYVIIILLVGILIYNKICKKGCPIISKENKEIIKIILLPSIGFFIIATLASPWNVLRYVVPVFGLIFVIAIYYLYKVFQIGTGEKICNTLLVVIFCMILISPLVFHMEPELLYSDSVLPFNYGHYQPGLEAVARLYNRSAEKHGSNQAVYTQKDRNPDIYRVGVLDIEKSQLPGIMEHPWQTDTCIGNWFYDAKQDYKKPAHIIEMLIDIVSKNGTMLLNVLQKPDGTIDEWEEHILKELGGWFEVCHEGIYGTRPFRVFSEGDTRATINGFEESKTSWSSSDYRFTTKNGCLYAFMMCAPESGVAVIKSLNESERVKEVSLLGCGGLEFNQSFGVLSVRLPERLPTKYTNCLKISFH